MLIFFLPLFVQANKDSLLAILKSDRHDSLKLDAMTRLMNTFENSGNDSAGIFATKMYGLALRTGDHRSLGEYYNFIGRKHYYVQAFDSALANFQRAWTYYEKGKGIKGMISARTNIAAVYLERGDSKNSLKAYRELIDLCTKNNAEGHLGTIYANVAVWYDRARIYDSSIIYYNLSVRNYEKFKRPDLIPLGYINLAVVNSNMKEDKKALEYLDRIFLEKLPVKKHLFSRIWSLKAGFFRDMKMLDSAAAYAQKAIQVAQETNDRLSLIGGYSVFAQILAEQKNYEESEKMCRKELETAQSIGVTANLNRAYHDLAQILLLRAKYKESLEFFRKALSAEIQMQNTNNTFETLKGLSRAQMKSGQLDSALIFLDSALRFNQHSNDLQRFRDMKEIEARYETEKKDIQIEKANTEIELQAETNRQKSMVIWVGSVALALTIFFAFMALFNFRKAKNFAAKVQEQNTSLEKQKRELAEQKDLVEEKQQEIIASINYAQRIQSAVLTGDDVWKRFAREYFILFKPKDIVSGDFYWAHLLQNGRAVFAVADCTGHGVPGGFMSMLGNSFLNEIVVENKIFSAAKILNKLREKVIRAMEQKGNTIQQDGMDMAICVWNKMDNSLEFAGANNNAYIFRKGKCTELKGDKMPVGTHVNQDTEFGSQNYKLEPGDAIYLTTDGFVDQFGGPKGKKYKYSQLETVLTSIQDVPLEQQAEILKMDFENWKGGIEQTDDVCLVGIRI